ncbi:MAG: ssDNA endodeoxyribonuclease [Vezdaea aestivalis]|nr:MAG: ssDNA endodeoxyribonuclease [Vezdaea aestivalis]
MSTFDDRSSPIFDAVANSPKQLFQLLRCVSFSSKAKVEISSKGLKFQVEDSRAVQASVILGETLFTSYMFDAPPEDSQEDRPELIIFEVSLAALLETLQIFNLESRPSRPTAPSTLSSNRPSAFAPQSLGATSICRLSYPSLGDPLQLILTESGVTTTCNLHTYEAEEFDEIPFSKTELAYKVILQSDLLHDALQELSSTSPSRLTMVVSRDAPFFALSASGPLGSATVEFAKDTTLLQTFQVAQRTVNSYKFSMVNAAARAMALANKVSIRGDEQGVMNFQFLVEDEGSRDDSTFVNFFFVPFLDEDEDGDYHDEESRSE